MRFSKLLRGQETQTIQNRRLKRVSAKSMLLNKTIGRRLLNVREASEYLGLDEDTLYRKARLRELPSVKFGRALRFDLKVLDRLIEKHAVEPID